MHWKVSNASHWKKIRKVVVCCFSFFKPGKSSAIRSFLLQNRRHSLQTFWGRIINFCISWSKQVSCMASSQLHFGRSRWAHYSPLRPEDIVGLYTHKITGLPTSKLTDTNKGEILKWKRGSLIDSCSWKKYIKNQNSTVLIIPLSFFFWHQVLTPRKAMLLHLFWPINIVTVFDTHVKRCQNVT